MFQDHICSDAIDLNCFIFMDHRIELSDTIAPIINALSAIQTVSQENQYSLQTYALRLEVLAETCLAPVDIPLEVVDILNSARTYIKNVCGSSASGLWYEAPLTRNGERGRPKFAITGEQLERNEAANKTKSDKVLTNYSF